MPALSSQRAAVLLGGARVARLATIGPYGAPHLVPVTFAVDSSAAGLVLYTAVDAKPKTTLQLQRLDNIRRDPRVTVLADHYADDWTQLWWVRADGRAVIRTDSAGQAGALSLLAAKYPQYREQPPAGPVIAVTIRRLTGWAAAVPG